MIYYLYSIIFLFSGKNIIFTFFQLTFVALLGIELTNQQSTGKNKLVYECSSILRGASISI